MSARRLLSEEGCRPSLLRRERELWQLSTISWPTRIHRFRGRRSRPLPGPPLAEECSCFRFTRLLLVQLIFLVTDRSHSRGHAL